MLSELSSISEQSNESRGQIQREKWRMGPYAGADYNPTLLQDRMLNSTPQHGCIWTKVFLAWKVFFASGQG